MSHEEIEERTEQLLVEGNITGAYYYLCEKLESEPWDNSISNILAFVCICNNYWNEAKLLLSVQSYESFDDYALLSKASICLYEGDKITPEDVFSKIIEKFRFSHDQLAGIFTKLNCLGLTKTSYFFGQLLKQYNVLDEDQDHQLLWEITTMERYYGYLDALKKEYSKMDDFIETIRNVICCGSLILQILVVYKEVKEALIAFNNSASSRKDVLCMLCFISSIINDKKETELFLKKAKHLENETYYQLAKAKYALSNNMFGSAFINMKNIVRINKQNKSVLLNFYTQLNFYSRISIFSLYFGKLLYKEGIFKKYDPKTDDETMEKFFLGDNIENVYLEAYPDESYLQSIYFLLDLSPEKEHQILKLIRKYILFIYPWAPKLLSRIQNRKTIIYELSMQFIIRELNTLLQILTEHIEYDDQEVKVLRDAIEAIKLFL